MASAAIYHPNGAYLFVALEASREVAVLDAAGKRALMLAGGTDVGLWVTKMHMRFDQVLDATNCEELRRIEHYDRHIAIGAVVSNANASKGVS